MYGQYLIVISFPVKMKLKAQTHPQEENSPF